MKRFVVVNTGGVKPLVEVHELLAKLPGIHVLDGTRKSLLVSGDRRTLEKALVQLDGWELTSERMQPLPSTRPSLKKRLQN
jgi:hypothetical protein